MANSGETAVCTHIAEPSALLDVYMIAENWSAVPIKRWTVRATRSGMVLATIVDIHGDFVVTCATGERMVCTTLIEARDAVAAAFTPRVLN